MKRTQLQAKWKRQATAKRRTRTAYRSPKGRMQTSGYYGRFTTGGERKFHDVDLALTPVTALLAINNTGVIVQGNSESERIGRKITLRSINIRGALKLNAATTAASSANEFRIMIVQDTQTNGAIFAATQLLETDTIESFRNLANSSRFKVLKTKEISLNAGGAAPSGAALVFGEAHRRFTMNIPCAIPIEYDNSSTDGAITSVRSNNIYFCIQAETATGTTLSGTLRLRYSDR